MILKFLFVLTLAAMLAGCGKIGQAEAGSNAPAADTKAAPANPTGVVTLGPDAPELKEMKVEVVQTTMVAAGEATAPAKVEANPNRIGHAVLPISGRIVSVMVKLGDTVTQGQPVVTIEGSAVAENESSYVQADAGVRQAELAAAKADADLARLTDLYEHQAVAQKEVLAARTTAALSKAAVEQAESVREQAKRKLELLGLKPGQSQQQVIVTAPISGKVMEVHVVPGEYHNEINAPLITVSDLSRVWATSQVPESEIRYYKLGGAANLELIAYPNEIFRARVTRIADTVDSETRTINVSAELENPGGRLRPEMFGRLHYASGMTASPWVPDAAVVRLDGKDYVFTEQTKGRFALTEVELGARHQEGFAVNKGIKAGDRVVTQGSVYLKGAL